MIAYLGENPPAGKPTRMLRRIIGIVTESYDETYDYDVGIESETLGDAIDALENERQRAIADEEWTRRNPGVDPTDNRI